jgi:hypothetical protein
VGRGQGDERDEVCAIIGLYGAEAVDWELGGFGTGVYAELQAGRS